MTDLAIAAQQLAEELTETLGAEKISYLDVLDALATSGLILERIPDSNVTGIYLHSCELEGLVA